MPDWPFTAALVFSPFVVPLLLQAVGPVVRAAQRFPRTTCVLGAAGVVLLHAGIVVGTGAWYDVAMPAGALLSGLLLLRMLHLPHGGGEDDDSGGPGHGGPDRPDDPGPPADWDAFDRARRSWERPRVPA
ncbi:MAG TPA: hypothetical protein VD931_06765 [Baekduia sp.]|nr:hypothetical protein [Baekduia sp.]